LAGRLLSRETLPFLVALLLLLAALLLPPISIPRDVQTYLVFIDISQSMSVEDYELDGAPASRLDYTRRAVRRALLDLPCGSRIGLGAFTEYRTLLLLAPIEVCGNYDNLLTTLGYIDGRMRWKNSSEIAKGVSWSVRSARDIGEGTQVVFVTDGQEAPPLRPNVRPLFDDVKPGQVRGWIIGAGGDIPRPIPRTDRNGEPAGYWRAEDVVQRSGEAKGGGAGSEHLSSLRETYLKEIAQRVGFEYARLTSIASLGESMRDARFAHREPVPTDLYWIPAAAWLLLLAWRFRPEVRHLKNISLAYRLAGAKKDAHGILRI
jgi:mxaL protein